MRLCLALIALLFGVAPVHGQERVIRFGLTGDYPPFAERGQDGSLAGADIVTARQVAKAMGARADFVMTDWQSLAKDFSAGRFDVAIGGLTVTPERAAIGTFSVALMDDGKRPLARCGERRRYRTLAAIDRPGTRVMLNRVPQMIDLAKGWFHQATVTFHDPAATLPDALIDRREDVWVTDGVVVDHMARRYKSVLCATTATPFTHLTKAWLIRSDPQLVAAIDANLKRALASGTWLRALRAVR